MDGSWTERTRVLIICERCVGRTELGFGRAQDDMIGCQISFGFCYVLFVLILFFFGFLHASRSFGFWFWFRC